MIKYFDKKVKDGAFVDHTLFLPAVSVGNIGQLTVDVILENAGPSVPQKIGRIFHPGIEAVVGCDPCPANGDQSQLVTSCELFEIPEKKYIFAHFHAPVTMKRREEFVGFLCDWIQRANFKQVVCFSSTFASDRNDQQLGSCPMRFIASDKCDTTLTDKLQSMDWEQMEKRNFPAPAVIEGSMQSLDNGVLHVPGSGITLRLFEKCQEKKIPFLAMIMFASEGDNTPESLTMFESANKLFCFTSKSNLDDPSNPPINIPPTWSHFHGRSHPVELY